jgi:hypothetical protein
MKALARMVDEYLALRRSLGFKLIDTEYVLKWFLAFMKREHQTHISTEALLRWVHGSDRVALPQRSSRFSIVRVLSVSVRESRCPRRVRLPILRFGRRVGDEECGSGESGGRWTRS